MNKLYVNPTVEQMKSALVELIQMRGFTFVESTDEVERLLTEEYVTLNKPVRFPPGMLASRNDGTGGITDNDKMVVVVRHDLWPDHQLQVIAHELAHVALNHSTVDDVDVLVYLVTNKPESIIAIKEIEAESTANGLLGLFGLNSDSHSESYINGYAKLLGEEVYTSLFDQLAKKAGLLAADLVIEVNDKLWSE